jgi:hypothetical protein
MQALKPFKIVSGGQTGADRAALDWELARGWPHGGWCPADRRAEDGTLDPRYGLRPTPSENVAQRTEWNVRDSDATLIVSVEPLLSGGSRLTQVLAEQRAKPCLHLSGDLAAALAAELLRGFVAHHRVKILNVAGPRATKEAGVYDLTWKLLERAFGPEAKGGNIGKAV